jgi:hypothetical protein
MKQCQATTKAGQRCTFKSFRPDGLCNLHGGPLPPADPGPAEGAGSVIGVGALSGVGPAVIQLPRRQEPRPAPHSEAPRRRKGLGTGKLKCKVCGWPLRDHSVSERCL